MSVDAAKEKAVDAGLDIVVVAPKATPPVCKLMDKGKFLYEKRKSVKRQPKQQNKEIIVRPRIAEGDYQIKFKHILQFLEQGHRVRVTLKFRGREMTHREIGLELMQKMAVELEATELGSIDRQPELEGRKITMQVIPTKPAPAT